MQDVVSPCEAGWFLLQVALAREEIWDSNANAVRSRAEKARLSKAKKSKTIADIILRHVEACWSTKRTRRKKANATAGEIMDAVNKDLADQGIRPLKQDAIRKRIK